MITVLHVLEATAGGTRRHLRDLVGALEPLGFRCALAVSCRRDPAFRADVAGYVARGLAVVEIPMRRGLAPCADAVGLLRLIGAIRRVRPSVIHAHSAKGGLLARMAGAVCRVPVVYTPHAFPFLMACGPGRRRVYRRVERGLRHLTAAVIAVSEEERRAAAALGYSASRIHLIPNGVDGKVPGEVTVRASGELRVGFFGRLTAQKGPSVLLEAAAEVVAHLPSVRFVFYGDGVEADTLRARAGALKLNDAVRFVAPVAQEEVVAHMRLTDVIAFPSRWEGCPYVVLEAFQAGVPVAAAAVGGVPDLIRDGVTGVLVEPDNPEALCDALLALLRDPQKRRRIAGQARDELERHRLDEMAAAVAAVYRRVTQDRP